MLLTDITFLVKVGATESKNVCNLLRYSKSSLPSVWKVRRTELLFCRPVLCLEEVENDVRCALRTLKLQVRNVLRE